VKKITAFVIVLLAQATSCFSANVIVPTTLDSQWNPMLLSNQGGSAYWDNTSGDIDPFIGGVQGGANIGYYLTGNFGFNGSIDNVGAHTIYTPGALSNALNQSPSNWQYLSTVSTPYAGHTVTGPAPFQLAANTTYTFNDLGSITADISSVMGWYALSDPSVLHPIFTGRSPSPDTFTLTTTEDIGLYFTSSGVNATERSTDSLPTFDGNNDNDDNLNMHQVIGNGMTVFHQIGGTFTGFGSTVIGFEDTWDTSFNGEGLTDTGFRGDSDYNDLIVGIMTFADIPEPATAVLLGCAAMAGVIACRRRTRTRLSFRAGSRSRGQQ
jgi:hypothetical protein